jgi:uncharacterized protein (DUF1800 family)
MRPEAYVAATRFGYGPRPGDLPSINRDPRGWLDAQIGNTTLPAPLQDLPGSAPLIAKMITEQSKPQGFADYIRTEARPAFDREVGRRTTAAAASDAPFRERLVHFWSNHFTVSVKRVQIMSSAGAFEREAIRPHVFGKFEDMLIAVAQHPAMLIYLDNQYSFGPNSLAGRRRDVGLNENLAREILELHTLGVDGGYRQDDVISLAKLITGWGVARPQDRRESTPGTFLFREPGHEPGGKTLLGKSYRQGGVAEGEAALRDLARHPATARFIAGKLARHFFADDPDPETVARLARVFTDTEGDLAALSRALIDAPEPWDAPLDKFKTPNDLVISTLRALDAPDLRDKDMVGPLALMGQLPFTAPSPAGWSDRSADWLGPEALMTRIEWLRAVSAYTPIPNTLRWADSLLGPVLSDDTRIVVSQAQSESEAVALVFASPEFQRK